MKPAAARALFARWAPLFEVSAPCAKGVGFQLRHKHVIPRATSKRDIAWYDPATHTVNLLQRGLLFHPDVILGVLLHELGHAADHQPDQPAAERRADSIAQWCSGLPIRYNAMGLQTVGPGDPYRPDWLHQ